MAEFGQLASARKSGRPRADHRNGSSCGGSSNFGMNTMVARIIHGVALEAANRNGLMFRTQDTGSFTQLLYRADPRAGRAQQIGRKDGLRRAFQIAGSDLLDEARNVNMRRARVGAGGVEAVQTPVRLNRSGMRGQWRQLFRERIAGSFRCHLHPSASGLFTDELDVQKVKKG